MATPPNLPPPPGEATWLKAVRPDNPSRVALSSPRPDRFCPVTLEDPRQGAGPSPARVPERLGGQDNRLPPPPLECGQLETRNSIFVCQSTRLGPRVASVHLAHIDATCDQDPGPQSRFPAASGACATYRLRMNEARAVTPFHTENTKTAMRPQ